MKLSLLVGVALVAYLLGFGVMFGSHLGLMSDLVHWDLNAKTKLLNSLAMFGYLALGGAAVLALKRTHDGWFIGVGLLVIIALSYGFSSVDCAIFNFCGVGR